MYRSDEQLILSPTDLNNQVECAHLTTLNRAYADGDRTHTPAQGAEAGLLSHKGDEHELAYLESLKRAGHEVVEIDEPADRSPGALQTCAELTAKAMNDGAEVIFRGLSGSRHSEVTQTSCSELTGRPRRAGTATKSPTRS